MSAHLDIVGSIIIAGMLLFGIAQYHADRQAALVNVSSQSSNQQYLESATSLLMFDLRKAGYRVQSGNAFLVCEPTRVVFRGDLENDGKVDTVTYIWRGAVTYTPNPRDTLLWRLVNVPAAMSMTGSSLGRGSDLGIVGLRFRYYTSTGAETTTPSAVRTVRVTLQIQSRYPIGGEYQEISSDFRVTPKNIGL
ncbi:MAG: hypothetical protein QHI48_12535 [Bacteroidota bacterium]|nr:hypothetical protein [Bacteroidota bacterium]